MALSDIRSEFKVPLSSKQDRDRSMNPSSSWETYTEDTSCQRSDLHISSTRWNKFMGPSWLHMISLSQQILHVCTDTEMYTLAFCFVYISHLQRWKQITDHKESLPSPAIKIPHSGVCPEYLEQQLSYREFCMVESLYKVHPKSIIPKA